MTMAQLILFDAFKEQENIWESRKRSSGSIIGIMNDSGKSYIEARAKAVEDSPWPVHLMGFHLGRALRMLMHDITERFLKCTSEFGEEIDSTLDDSSTAPVATSGTSQFNPASFITDPDDSKECMLEEIGEQVRLLKEYGVYVDLSSKALESTRISLEEKLNIIGSADSMKNRDIKVDGNIKLTSAAKKGKEIKKKKETKTKNINTSGAKRTSGQTETSFTSSTTEEKKKSSTIVNEHSGSTEVVKKKAQGRPKRSRRQDDIHQSAEPVTLAGAVKLARMRELRLREDMRAAREEAQRMQLLEKASVKGICEPHIVPDYSRQQNTAGENNISEQEGDGNGSRENTPADTGVLEGSNTTSRNIRSLDRVEEDKAKRGLVAVQALEGLQLRTSPSSSRSEGLIQVSMKASGHGDGDGDGDGSLLYGEMVVLERR